MYITPHCRQEDLSPFGKVTGASNAHEMTTAEINCPGDLHGFHDVQFAVLDRLAEALDSAPQRTIDDVCSGYSLFHQEIQILGEPIRFPADESVSNSSLSSTIVRDVRI